MTSETLTTFQVGNHGDGTIEVAFEPSGMSYRLEPRAWLSVRYRTDKNTSPEVVHSPDCVSFWLWGEVVISDGNGVELGRLDH